MQKLIMLWLVGAAVLALLPLDNAGARPTDEDAMGAEARMAQLQAILDEEDEGLADDGEFEGAPEDPEDQGDSEDDLEDQDDQEDPPDERGSSREWGTPS